MLHGIFTITGIDTSTLAGALWYNFWSGIFGDAGLFAAAIGLYFHNVCHTEACHRWGRHRKDGSPYCKKHLEEK